MASLDFDRSIAFYEQMLGFRNTFKVPSRIGFERDGIEIHLWPCKDKHIAENTSCLFMVSNIVPLYEEYKQKDIIHPAGHLEKKPWGLNQFGVLDIDGNLLQFGEPIN